MKSKVETILVPIDFNEQSMYALERSQLTAPFLNLDIVLLYVYEEQGFAGSIMSKENIDGIINKKLEETANKVRNKAKVKVTTAVREGKVYHEIIKAANEFNSRFILMGTNNSAERVRMDKNTIGSNTLKVVRQSPIPVITINGKEVTWQKRLAPA